MGSIPPEFPISLRSWPTDTDFKSDLPELIRRINFERGGFREISEESLRQEIAEEEANAGDDSSEEDEEEKPDRTKELFTAREEMIDQIGQAHQQTLFALEFVSLLLSKDQPNTASLTLSPFLRETLGTGTLGADRIHATRITEEQRKDNRCVAKGWKIQNLNTAVDSILASATRLEKEIEVETKYWEQVLAVNEKGWAVCRLPNEKHTLGVRFGFSEAPPAFRNQSLAALRREVDGNVCLDQGLATAEPQYIRVQIEEHDDETGSSIIPSAIADDAPIEARIQQARNTVYNVELWQELNREARTLSSLGVRSKDDTLTCPLTGTKTIVIDIVPLEESTSSPPHPSRSDDNIAEGISLALHLLLSYNHRLSHRRRTQPPLPLSAQKRPIPPAPLLRPLITRLAHQTNLSSIQGLLTPLSTILSSLGLTPLPTYTFSTPPPPPHLASLPPTEATTLSLIESITNTLTLTIHPSFTLKTTIRTTLFPPTTTFGLSVTPPSSPLNKTCKSPGILDTFPKTREYLLFATSCALAYLSTGPLAPGSSLAWEGTARPYVLRLVSSSGIDVGIAKQLAFSVDFLEEGDGKRGLEVTLAWERTSEVRGNTFEELAEEGAGIGQKVNKGEGWYKWFLKEGKVEGRGVAGARGAWGIGEAVKGLREVVEIAAKA